MGVGGGVVVVVVGGGEWVSGGSSGAEGAALVIEITGFSLFYCSDLIDGRG